MLVGMLYILFSKRKCITGVLKKGIQILPPTHASPTRQDKRLSALAHLNHFALQADKEADPPRAFIAFAGRTGKAQLKRRRQSLLFNAFWGKFFFGDIKRYNILYCVKISQKQRII